MKLRKRTAFEIVGAGVVVTLAIVFALPVPRSYLLRVGMSILARRVKQGQIDLLCKTNHHALLKTNHHALLKACRALSEKVEAGDLAPRTYYVRSQKRPPEVSQFPKLILDLSPRSVTLHRDGRVVLQMGGGFANFGVFAYPKDYKEPYRNFVYGNRKIIDGLWYHDADYEGSPKHQKWIRGLIRKGKQETREAKGVIP
jgi:hypothetical protein